MGLRRDRKVTNGTILLLLVFCARGAGADEGRSERGSKGGGNGARKYLRVRRDQDGAPRALETAVTRFVGRQAEAGPVVVDLIGAVHVGEASYYERLNGLFKAYDAVLYELVAPPGTRVVPEQRDTGHPISFLQDAMTKVLKLEFQLDQIDYTASNMVHADMSPAEFSETMKARGESFLKMFFRIMRQSMATQLTQRNGPSDMELLVALIAKDRAYRLQRVMAEQFEDMEGQLSAINGPDGSTIITERNKRALRVLRDQLAKGQNKLAIFYGAGHLPDMAQRLEKEFGLRRGKQRWVVAWTITAPSEQPVRESAAVEKP
ncbi:MAG: hypothetical protein ACQESR_21455 [Planctomycetota bacterium]